MDFIQNNATIKIIPEDVKGVSNGTVTSLNSDSFTVKLDSIENESLTPGSNIEIILPSENCLIKFETKVIKKEDNTVFFVIPQEYKRVQRREYTRIDLNIPIDLKDANKAEDQIITTTINISGGGLQVVTTKDFDIGTLLEAQFTVYDNKSINTLLEVLRVEANESDQKEYFLSGQFKDISNSDRIAIIQLCFKKQLERKLKGVN